MTTQVVRDWEKELAEIYPVFFVTNTPLNDFSAAADETTRLLDRQYMLLKLTCFIESLLTSHTKALKEKIEGMKKPKVQYPIPCPDGIAGCAVYHCEMKVTPQGEIYNEAIDDVLALTNE